MAVPDSLDALLALVRESGLIEEDALTRLIQSPSFPRRAEEALEAMVKAGLLTRFHANHLAQGKYKGFLVGPYKVLRPLAKGGMGIVYLAEHNELKRRVAIKVLLRDLPENMGAQERFSREARAIATLDHPHIVRVHDFGRDGDLTYMVMEHLEGKSFEQLLQEHGRFSVPEVAGWMIQAAEAIQHAHERGLMHRDIKPANLMLTKGTVKVLDLGLARFYEDTKDDLTQRLGKGVILGSPDYMAPEQALHQFDRRSDIYSLGATMYALLIGEPPFADPTASQKLMAHQMRDAVPLHRRDRRIPVELSRLVVRMMAKRPEDRPQELEEVIKALRPWAEAPAPRAPLESASLEAPSSGGLSVRAWIGIVLAAALTTGLAVWAILSARP